MPGSTSSHPPLRPLHGAAFAVTFAVAFAVALGSGCSRDETPKTAATYVGRASCKACHEKQHDAWHGSHHDLAMQPATAETVLGDFDGATFDHFGIVSRFFRDGDRFMVHTDGPDGVLADFQVRYVFGVYPLQSYLVGFPRGRMQALSICWDARPKAEGGQRWFHLYREKIDHKDELHWTGRAQNWNYMCANCHSTNLRKDYDVASDTYSTSWSEIDVSCETCHGPASHHLTWAADRGLAYAHKGFAGPIHNRVTWGFEKGAVTATRRGGENARLQTETCARCHSRRSTMAEGHVHGRLHDAERVSFLEPLLYHPDGQILDEVYVYGSFVQSKMYHAGVTCTDCHDPHTLKTHAPGNSLCVRCHQAATFDTPAHHHHPAGSTGASCTACHMPTRNYMVVDPRLDHSIRIPRPDLSVKLGTPNACNRCHDDREPVWAAEAIAKWKPDYRPKPHYGEALHAARQDRPGAGDALLRLAGDRTQPAIARATALDGLRATLRADTLPVLHRAVEDPDPMVRRGAVEALADAPLQERLVLGGPLLKDPVRAVRIAAARILAEVAGAISTAAAGGATPPLTWPGGMEQAFAAAMAEYEAFQVLNGDQPWAHTNLGIVLFQRGRFDEAVAAYERALRIDDRWVHAYVNLADLHRHRGSDQRCEQVLRQGLMQVPDSADLNHSLGLTLHRRGDSKGALVALQRAARQRPDVPRYAYAYGVALHSLGQVPQAMQELEAAHRRTPRDFEILEALASYNLAANRIDEAQRWVRLLYELEPGHPRVQELMQRLRR